MTTNRHSVQITLIQRHDNDNPVRITKAGETSGISSYIDEKDKINRNNCFRLFKGHIRNQESEILGAGWVELFFDLIYVACIMHICNEVAYSLDHPHLHVQSNRGSSNDPLCKRQWKYSYILTSFSQFALFTQTWRDKVLYMNHFVFTQEIDEILRLFYMLFVLSMGIFISDSHFYHVGFQISYILLRIVSVFMHFKVIMIPNSRSYGILQICTSMLTIILILLLLIFDELYDGCAIEYFIIYIVLFIVDYIGH